MIGLEGTAGCASLGCGNIHPFINTIAVAYLQLKSMDANRYATKKTIAQGMLDIALLTANASQLKYILQVGEKHEFYALMLTLISISIILQVSAAMLAVILTLVNLHAGTVQRKVANILNHFSLGFVVVALFCDVIKMNFGLDPAVPSIAQGISCILLANYNINKEHSRDTANAVQNFSLGLNMATVVVNVLISGMEVKHMDDICGLYNERSESHLYRMYRYTFNFTMVAAYLFTMTLNIFVMQTFEQLVLFIMYILFTEIVMLLKAFITYYKFDQIRRLYRQTVDESFEPQDDLEASLHRKGVEFIKYYYYIYIVLANVALETENVGWKNFILPVRLTVWTWKICGLYAERPESRLYRMYRYTFNFTMVAVYLFTMTLNIFVMQTFEQLVLFIMYILFTEIVMLLKALITYYKFDQIRRLYHQTVDESFEPQDDLEASLHRKGVGFIKYYYYIFFVMGHIAMGSTLLLLLQKKRLPYFPWMLGVEYGPENLITYGVFFAYQYIGMYFHMLVNVSGDAQLCYFLGMVSTQLDILAKRFRQLRTSEDLERSFAGLIDHYEKVYRMVHEVQQLYAPAFFAQFGVSSVVICAAAVNVASNFNLAEPGVLQHLLYMLSMMFQMFLPCLFGNEVTRKSNDLKTAVYSSQWYRMKVKDRKMIIMLMQRLNKPLTVKAYHFFNYNLQAFTTTLNMAYRVYAVLQRNALKN
ncbi:odorant receptor 94a-like [Anopheles cruzii]|uniref:odorant receptor 94a-like n=1 Tax=Anopheles cruzii TaxID=68878 RepID=UPI0022EC773D|nr:odorant receptor 94a-like [Anopheles cruzii]